MRNAILTANSLRDLAGRSRQVPALDQPLAAVVPELEVPDDARRRLAALGQTANLSVRRFLDEKALHSVVAETTPYATLLRSFKTWVAGKLPAAAGPGASLQAVLAALALPDLEAWPAALFVGQIYPTIRLGQLLKNEYGRQWAGQLEPALGRFAASIAEARARDLAQPLASRLTALGDPELDGLRAALCALRTSQLAPWPIGTLFPERAAVQNDDEVVELAVRLVPGAESVCVRLGSVARWRDRLALTCGCRLEACVHRAIFVDVVLSQTAKADSKVSQTLKQLMTPPWHRALELLEAPAEQAEKREALSFVAREGELNVYLHPIGKRGLGKGRRTYLTEVYKHAAKLEGLDRRIAELLQLSELRYDRGTPELGDVLLLLEGHPRVHLEEGGPAVPVRVRTAAVTVEEQEARVRLRVEADPDGLRGHESSRGPVRVVCAEDAVTLVVTPPALRRLADVVSRFGGDFPREALPRLAALLPGFEAVTQVELPETLRGQQVPPQNRPVLRLDTADGVTVRLGIEPLPGGAVFVPGEGVPVAATFDGTHRRFTHRALEAEVAEATALAAELGLGQSPEPFTWRVDGADECVELMRRVSALGARATVEWAGARPTFRKEVGLEKLKLKVTAQRDWFGLEGQLAVDDARVTLAQLLEAARARRRWVRLGEADFASLSQELLDRLAPLAHLAGTEATPTLTLGTVPLVDELAAVVAELDAAKGYRALVARLAQAKERRYPVPAKLRATLRDYQQEGFAWLSRLADWGAGAVLADDMGLGKTLQALALLVARAGEGPALVVAPSSVLHTWRTEAARFAPSLRLRFFHEGDRELKALGKGEVLVVSWSLFAREAERFHAQRFATAVLDEAQAIKNAGTQRAKAAHGLEAGFVVALSGTPVENHVGELWSLFRAAVPSLLGSEEGFQERFGSGRGQSLAALSRLVQPFILRRTKDTVAKELPARTELDVVVPLSPAERELYEDVRLAAVKELGDVAGADKRFEILAALTRLRLAACHPRLVDQAWSGPTSKLARLLELVRDLSASGHRALVFSQFTQHLGLVAEALRTEGLAFSYLDGQVPTGERARRVDAFQQGKGGDVFLISLKAGGTGLTLTAADYVIHLDPWWNPAVEDQASDRAHRIGQTRPVTIYRLLCEGTIEQQILSLHAQKRELVDALLAGTDTAGKLSAQQLAALIRERPAS